MFRVQNEDPHDMVDETKVSTARYAVYMRKMAHFQPFMSQNEDSFSIIFHRDPLTVKQMNI